MTTETIEAAVKRIQRKADIVRMDVKKVNAGIAYDMGEIMSLCDLILKNLKNE